MGDVKFEDNNIRYRRKNDPETFRYMVKDLGLGAKLLAIKYDKHLDVVNNAIERLGGIDYMLDAMPHVFDMAVKKPIKSRNK